MVIFLFLTVAAPTVGTADDGVKHNPKKREQEILVSNIFVISINSIVSGLSAAAVPEALHLYYHRYT